MNVEVSGYGLWWKNVWSRWGLANTLRRV